jgi:hypothetical protein
VAANLHGSLRSTKDIDILVPKEKRNTDQLLAALSELPYGIARELDADDILKKPITIVGDDPRVDILLVAWKVTYEKARLKRRVRNILGVRVPYLSLADLILSKQTGRAQDQADLEVLASQRKKPREEE